MALSLHDLSLARLGEVLAASGVNAAHARALWQTLYGLGSTGLENAAFPRPLREWVKDRVGPDKEFFCETLDVVREHRGSDLCSHKFLLQLRDGQRIETVLMRYDKRHTVCVSSQVGCAMACVFCATGQSGFVRHLRRGEIIAQVLHARQVVEQTAPGQRLRNLVMMGMGEPLHNLDEVLAALETISDTRGLGIGPSRITISTVGIVPGILRLAEERVPYNLAVSLHGSTNEERGALVPVARKWNLETLMQACRHYCRATGRRIFFEYTLIAGRNDSPATARRLVDLLRGVDAHVNLIPLNPTPGYQGRASREGGTFHHILRRGGLPCTFRQYRGIDVEAGCGMLRAEPGSGKGAS